MLFRFTTRRLAQGTFRKPVQWTRAAVTTLRSKVVGPTAVGSLVLGGAGVVTAVTFFSTKPELPKTMLLHSHCTQIPHPMKKHKGGEDAFFISGDGTAVGVFDGVGGWADEGVDPREFAVALANGCLNAVSEAKIRNPVEILKYGFNIAKSVLGSSTACIAVMNQDKLRTANLGDSGYFIFRNDSIIFRSVEQQHRFNMPYQLTGGYPTGDVPEDADVHEHDVLPGDLIVLGTDGLFDNLDDEVMAKTVMAEVTASENKDNLVERVANALATKAFQVSRQKYALTPFAKHANEAYGRGAYIGGKPDDITVLVSQVKRQDEWKDVYGDRKSELRPPSSEESSTDNSKGDLGFKSRFMAWRQWLTSYARM